MLHIVLREIVLVFGVALVVAYLLGKLRIPNVVGFMVAGAALGPGGLAIIEDRHQIEVLAEIGVILLLFGVGMKISFAELWALRRFVFGAGLAQVVITTAIAAAIGVQWGLETNVAVVVGFFVAVSSTAMVLRLLEQRAESDAPQGRLMLGVLLMQDLAVVPILFALPLLAGAAEGSVGSALLVVARASAVLVAALLLARYVFPFMAERAVKARSPELFTLVTALGVFGTALLVGEFGLSMALGAFLAGMVVSESVYSQQIVSEINTLREAFNSLFFVSIGMLVDLALWSREPVTLLILLVGIIALKALLAGGAAALFLRSARHGLVVGAGLAHVGEFSFVVASQAALLGLFDEWLYAMLLAGAVPSMIFGPFALSLASRALKNAGPRDEDEEVEGNALEESGELALIVGYGVGGRHTAQTLQHLGVPYVVIDMNPDTVRSLRKEGVRAYYGDAGRELVLRKAGAERARALVVAVPDAAGARRVVALARQINPALTILVRTRFLLDVEELHRLGADEVVPEEYETSLELASRVLAAFGAPDDLVEREKSELRRRSSAIVSGSAPPLAQHALRALTRSAGLVELRVEEGGQAQRKSLRELDLRRRTGASVLALLRGREMLGQPDPDLELCEGDVLVVAGTAEALASARACFEGDEESPA